MRLAFDVNGVLRDTIGKFTQMYEKHMIEEKDDDSKTFDPGNQHDCRFQQIFLRKATTALHWFSPLTSAVHSVVDCIGLPRLVLQNCFDLLDWLC
jgi:hypothetical protein